MENEQQTVNNKVQTGNEKKDDDLTLKSFWIGLGDGGVGACIARIVLLALFALVPYFLGRIALYDAEAYAKAPYKYKVEATLIQKTKKVTDKWVPNRKKIREAGKNYAIIANSDDNRYREYKKHKRDVNYFLTWEFFIDGERHEVHTKSWLICLRGEGSKKSLKVYSEDGKEFKEGSATPSLFWTIILILSAVVFLFLVFCILGTFVGMIKAPFKKKALAKDAGDTANKS